MPLLIGTTVEWWPTFIYSTASVLCCPFGKRLRKWRRYTTGALVPPGSLWFPGFPGSTIGTFFARLAIDGNIPVATVMPHPLRIALATDEVVPLVPIALKAPCMAGIAVGGEWGGAVPASLRRTRAREGVVLLAPSAQGSPLIRPLMFGALLNRSVDDDFDAWAGAVPLRRMQVIGWWCALARESRSSPWLRDEKRMAKVHAGA